MTRDGRQEYYLVSRKNAVTQVQSRCQAPLPASQEERSLVNLFDGELMLDRHRNTPTFLVFDALNVFGSSNVMLLKFVDRLRKVQ